MDKLAAMRVFMRVAERGSFARAADDLDLARSQASSQVAALERELGVRLLNRTTRRVSLTADGSEYLERCRRALAEIDAAEEALRRDRARIAGRLRVDVPVTFGRALLIPALPQFLERYPALELDVRLEDRVTDLVAEQVDVAIRAGRIRQRDLIARRAGAMRMLLCASPEYLARVGVPERLEDLTSHRCIGISNPQTGRVGPWDFRRGAARRRVVVPYAVSFNSAEAGVLAAVNGIGIARGVDLMLAPHLVSGALQVVLPQWTGEGPTLSIVYPAAG
ncbi:MAG TPA: LysR substrate-binding domain-containing protein, partial [Steroidobacteraceae bacterium]|nr:LysR substrate-binding domain-containing protein [Steroidobacteraceae bacterium]